MYKKFTVVFFVLIQVLVAQIDSLECLDYLPLRIGNRWEYEGISMPPGMPEDTNYFVESVTRVVSMDNGKDYYEIVGQSINYLRIDTSALLVYQYGDMSSFGCQDSEFVLFDLSLICTEQGSFLRCDSIAIYTQLSEGNAGRIRGTFSNISYGWFDGVSWGYTLSQGLGISNFNYFEVGGFEKNLIGAEINGFKIGSFAERDTFELLSYYPMHIGDKWQYMNVTTGLLDDTTYSHKEIVGDTVLANGEKYYCISYDGSPHYQYERIDTVSLCVFRYSQGACTNNEIEMLYLWECYPNSSIIVYNCNDEYFEITRLDSVWIEIFHFYLTEQQYTLQKGIGVKYYSEFEAVSGCNSSLVAAVVNGVQFLGIDKHELIPDEFRLYSNYPNPFNPSTQMRYAIPRSGIVNLSIYDLRGQPVRTLVSEHKQAGEYDKSWDGKNDSGLDVASGIYIYILKFDEQTIQNNKMVKLK